MKSIRFSGSMRSASVLAALGTAAVVGAVPAQADSDSAPSTDAPISDTIEKFAQSICPSLVKPGSSLATTLSEAQGNTGLTPKLTGIVAGFVIQTQCPSVMSKLAHGDLSALQLPEGVDLADLAMPSKKPEPTGLDLSSLLKPAASEPEPTGLDLSALLKPAEPEPAPSGLDLAALLKAAGN